MEQATLLVCNTFRFSPTAPSCSAGGSAKLIAALRREIAGRGLAWAVAEAPCLGYCGQGPNLKARGGPLLHQCHPDAAATIVDRLLAEWRPTAQPDENDPAAVEWPLPGL